VGSTPARSWLAGDILRVVVDVREDFGPFAGRSWINCSHQGALPKVAADAAKEAIQWKRQPYELRSERFQEVPDRLRNALGRLIGAASKEVILANSASYGIHLLANGLPLRAGDEVLLVEGDFPSVILPWLGLERKGVSIRFVRPGTDGLSAQELEASLSEKTKVLCTTWVHSFTGIALDLEALGRVCRSWGVRFLVNGAQAVGARPIDVSAIPIDALISVGFKWLCGPYGTGFCWMRPELLGSLEVNRAYWLAMQTADDLGKEDALPAPRDDLGARCYDVFGTANFFNFLPWAASVEYLLTKGIDQIAAHDATLVEHLIGGLKELGFRISSPERGPSRSTLVLASHEDRSRNAAIHRALENALVYVAFRRGNLRFSPHLYNNEEDVERTFRILRQSP
jgi:selenocysteine lyase/cysteine desulfurase